jgi:hypothetical protein
MWHWPIPVEPLPNEILSSWLVRVALAHGCDPMTLSGYVWPQWRAWITDLDRGLTDERLKQLSMSSGLELKSISDLTLLSNLVKHGFSPDLDISVWSWVLTMGSRNRIRKSGMQYCPECLREDHDPYFRWSWRLAWHTGCSIHNCALLARCPHCKEPVQYHRLTADKPHLAACFSCGNDLRKAPSIPLMPEKLIFQYSAEKVLLDGVGWFGSKQIPAADWFALARYFVDLLRKAGSKKRTSHLADFMNSSGVKMDELVMPSTMLPLELLPTDEREHLLTAIAPLLSCGEDKFISLAKEKGISTNSLMDHWLMPPEFFQHIVRQLPRNDVPHRSRQTNSIPRPRSKNAVLHQWARLLRKIGKLP